MKNNFSLQKIFSTKRNFKSPEFFAFALIAIFIIIFTLLSIGRHDSLKSYLNDLGVYDQLTWNALHGNLFQATSIMIAEKNNLAVHFTPIDILFVPFYLIWMSPKWFLFLQAAAVGASAIPIFLFAREKLKGKIAPLIFLAAYLFNPILHNGLLYDFHEVVFATFLASFAFYFLETKRDRLFILFSILLLFSQEHLSLLVFMMGLYLIFVKKRKKFGVAVSVVALTYFILVVSVFMPFFSSTGNLGILSNDAEYGARYGWLGTSLPQIAKNISNHPLAVLWAVLSKDRLIYFAKLMIPVFSLALFSWPVIIILPIVAINILSANGMMFNIWFYHSAVLVPFIFFASIVTFQNWFDSNPVLRKIFLASIFLASVASAFLWGVTPLSPRYTIADYISDAHEKKIDEVTKVLPKGASLSVQHNLGPHFSERKLIYRFPQKVDETQYVLVDETNPYQDNPQQIFDFKYALQMELPEWKEKIAELKNSGKYETVYDKDGYLLLKNKSPKI